MTDTPIRYALTPDGVNIAYVVKGEGPPLLNVPPLPWCHLEATTKATAYHDWMHRLANGRTFVTYDGRGFGLSDRGPQDFSLDAQVQDILTVADAAGLEKFDLLAISESTFPAVQLTARHPERVNRLMIWCGYPRAADAHSEQLQSIGALARTDWRLYTNTIAHALVAGWGAANEAMEFAEVMRAAATYEEMKRFHERSEPIDVTPLLGEITVPTLVMHRKEAQLPPVDIARRMAARIPGSHLALFEGGALLPFVGDVDDVLEAVHNFLGGPAPGPREAPPPQPARNNLATIVFTDLVESTNLTQRLGDEAARVLIRDHERAIREALSEHGGSEVKTMGDGFMATFSSATAALQCAADIQRATEEDPDGLRVRIGINAGEPIAEGQDLFGTAVIAASRIAAMAAGGEVLVADVVRQLVAGKGLLFADRGEAVLRGFDDPVRVYELRWRE